MKMDLRLKPIRFPSHTSILFFVLLLLFTKFCDKTLVEVADDAD